MFEIHRGRKRGNLFENPLAPFTLTITRPRNGGRITPDTPLSGLGTPGCLVTMYVDGCLFDTVPVRADGGWQAAPPAPWLPGTHHLRAVLSCPGCFKTLPEDCANFEVLPPACPPPIISLPENLAEITSNVPAIAGRGIPGSLVEVCLLSSVGETIFCQTVPVSERGIWAVQSHVTLAEGTYTIVAAQAGEACSQSGATRAFSVFTVITETLMVNIVDLTRGQVFRTVDFSVEASATPNTTLTLSYLLLALGQPIPTEEEVLHYDNAETLTTGLAVRGRFTLPLTATPTQFDFALRGKENLTPLPLETGVMDGFFYHIYVVGQTNTGQSTGVLTLFQPAMGMPFASGEGTAEDPFFIRMTTAQELDFYPDLTQGNPGNRAGVTETARILDNIEGMQALYDASGGTQGMPDSLALHYRFDAAFDLSNYGPAWGSSGWRPIGNTDPALLTPPLSGPHVFTGSVTMPTGGTTVSNLLINAVAAAQNPVLVRGFFGSVEGVSLSGFTLPNPVVTVVVTAAASASQTGKIGALAGCVKDGSLTDIVIETASISIGRAAGGSNLSYGGALAGLVEGASTVARITAGSLTLLETTPRATVLGGLIGRLDQAGAATQMTDIIVSRSQVDAYQSLGGVVGEIITAITLLARVTVTQAVLSHVGFRVGGLIGNLQGGRSTLEDLTVSQIQMGPNNPASSTGYAGGLLGQALLGASSVIRNATVTSGEVRSGGRVGGAIGYLAFQGGGILLQDIVVSAEVLPNNGPAGGLFGRIDLATTAPGIQIAQCQMTGPSVSTTGTSTSSSYVGGLVGYIVASGVSPTTAAIAFTDCTVTANVLNSGQETGGFGGRVSYASFLRCRALGDIQGRQMPGGFCGNAVGVAAANPNAPAVQFSLCQARGSVRQTGGAIFNSGTGGFLGRASYGLVDQCFSTGSVTVAGDTFTGGFIGANGTRVIMRDCYGTGSVSTSAGTVLGAFLGDGNGAQVTRCYGAGAVLGNNTAGGLLGSLQGAGTDSGILSVSLALGDSVSISASGGAVHRVCGVLGTGGQLSANYAIDTMTLTAGSATVTPVNNPNGLDGQAFAQSDMIALLSALGWDTATVWDSSTIAALGRPTLRGNPES